MYKIIFICLENIYGLQHYNTSGKSRCMAQIKGIISKPQKWQTVTQYELLKQNRILL
jgi:hypothetical protein